MATKYPEYKQINLARVADDVLDYWKKNDIFAQSMSSREGNPTFTFYEGPPSANGTPGIHHVMARTVKDIFCRYKTMKGFQVKRKGGWDTHGLPVELQVEKELGITKEDIGKKISVEEYNNQCRETVMRFKNRWDDLTEKMGYWVDLDDPYITFDSKYIESVWHLLKKFYDKDLLYKGFTIQPFSPKAGTGLSSHELNQPGTYRNVKDTSLTAQFKLAGSDNDYLLAWTTTPWTLPSNSGLAVGLKLDYVKVATFNPYTHEPVNVILAKSRLGAYFNDKAKDLALDDYKAGDKLIPFKVIETMTGKDLVGQKYEQLMPYVSLPDPAFTVIEGDFVTTEDGTGIVHLAMPFGADDFRALQSKNIPGMFVKDDEGNDVPLVDRQGRFRPEVTDFAGAYVKAEYYSDEEAAAEGFMPTDVRIAIKLKEENKAFKVEKYEHNYPHCWRTDKPILYYPLDSWFIKTTALRDRLVDLNKTINWKPESTGTGRFGNWLENLVDWNLSRSRFWGTPLPIWVTEDRKEEKCIGSLEELRAEIQKAIDAGFMTENIGDDFDLHRPYVDDIYLVSDSGQKMTRETDLIDVWFDSGAMPYAQWHYPFENKDIFEANYPADFIAEGVDQTRGWFFTLHAIASILFDTVAFKNVIANGLVLDKNGNKMSKRLGNAIDPFETLSQYGPDATRWYMISNANPWDNLKFNMDGIVEAQRKFFGTLQNTYSFFALYANLDSFSYEQAPVPMEKRTESDRWIISRLNSLIKKVNADFEDYEPTRATRSIQNFLNDELSNWYVRLNRKRFWKGEYNEDKVAAYQTLFECLLAVTKLSAPVAPFYTEQLFRDLEAVTGKDKVDSVHLALFPEADESLIDEELERKMYLAQHASSLVHSLRKKHKIKVRQPLNKALIPVLNEGMKAHLEAVEDIILNEVNLKELEYVDDASTVLVKQIKPNFAKLGKLYGPKMKHISKALGSFEQADIRKIEQENSYALEIEGETITLTLEDVEITSQDIPGWSVVTEEGITVALDITLTDDLLREGVARDIVNRVQNMRKDMGLEVQDKIAIKVGKADEIVAKAITEHEAYICGETQALQLEMDASLSNATVLEIDEHKAELEISKL